MASASIARPGLSLSQSFGYDAYNRLVTAAETGGTSEWSQTYGMDAWGNRAVTAGYIPNACCTPTTLGQFTNNQWLGTGVSYDAAGNQKTLPSRSFTYDAENRLITAREPNPGAISYVYDAEGKRVQKTVGTSQTTYVYDGFGQLAAEYSTQVSTSSLLYLTADTLGSTRLTTDGSGVAKECNDYFPFGEDIQQGIGGRGSCFPTGMYPSNPDIECIKFTGKERDAETGMDFFGARYMSSAQGRFTSPDPMIIDQARLLDPQQLNMYAYVRNNPLRFIDPLGLYTCADENKCAEFEKARQEALKSKDSDVVRAASAYGDLGKDNGVAVSFADKLKGDRGGTVSPRGTGIEQDPNSPNGLRAAVDVTIKSSEAGNQEVLVHEGSHTADRQEFVNAITPAGIMDQSLNITLRQSEIRAYTLSIGYAQRGNQTLNFGPCGVMGECKFPPGMMPAQRDQRIIDLLNDPRNNYKNPNSVLFPGLK